MNNGGGKMMRRCLAAVTAGAVLLLGAGCARPGRKPFPGPVEQRITIVAERFQFVPSTIELTQGKKAAIRIKSGDFAYGVAVPDLGLRARVSARKDTILRFTPKAKGNFSLLCTSPAGPPCENMRGTVRVK